MKKSEAILTISAKLQKQIHMMKSMTDNPKMLCDNLAMRVMTEIEEIKMLPPLYKKKLTEEEMEECDYQDPASFLGYEFVNEWEGEDDENL
jgi:hypothetical protein